MSTKLIVSCIGGTGALGGVVAGSYYLLNKETEKSQATNDTPSQKDQPVAKKTLKDQLAGTDFEALSTIEGEDKDTWKKLVAKYREVDTTGKISIVGAMNDGASDDNAANIEKLQKACATLLAKTDGIDNNDKTMGKNWCNKRSNLIPQG